MVPAQDGQARQVGVDQFPVELTMFLAGALTAGPACFFIGRWASLPALRRFEPWTNRLREDFPAILTYAAYIFSPAIRGVPAANPGMEAGAGEWRGTLLQRYQLPLERCLD
ncbi:hypothetical protein ACCS60_17270 [Rhizobium acaciae]|uniref:hypothetical protein n=1 Tax=Rhizobium acaciae TaxID=2989736 RepID=UPI003F97908D